MREERAARQRMKDFGQRGTHPLAGTSGQNDDVHGID
jgi:hypothetical protein